MSLIIEYLNFLIFQLSELIINISIILILIMNDWNFLGWFRAVHSRMSMFRALRGADPPSRTSKAYGAQGRAVPCLIHIKTTRNRMLSCYKLTVINFDVLYTELDILKYIEICVQRIRQCFCQFRYCSNLFFTMSLHARV